MANIKVVAGNSATNVTAVENTVNISVVKENTVNLQVTPTPNQVISIDKGQFGPSGFSGYSGYSGFSGLSLIHISEPTRPY